MKKILTTMAAGILTVTTAPIISVTQTQNQVKDYATSFQVTNNDQSFAIGSSLSSVHTEDYDLTNSTEITSWDQFSSVYHYFGYNGADAMGTNWYYSTIHQQCKTEGTHNSTFLLSSTVSQSSFNSQNPSNSIELRAADTYQFTSNYYMTPFINWVGENSADTELFFGCYWYNSSDGHLHFVTEMYVRNYEFAQLFANYTFLWTVSVGAYAQFWQ